MNLKALLQKYRSNIGNNAVKEVKNWYSDRYESVLVQRNILLVFVVISLFILFAGSFVVGQIASSKTIEPFIIEIENKTGITNIVKPMTVTELPANQALSTYFLMQYIRARETYSFTTYEYNYKTIVRLLSTTQIYRQFLQSINSNPRNPINTYSNANSTSLKLRSLQYLDTGKAQIRFSILESGGEKREFHKIATIDFEYDTMELTNDERQVNPLGFQITSYRADDETL